MTEETPILLLERNEPATDTPNPPVDEICPSCPPREISVVFDPKGSSIDADVDEYDDAQSLDLPAIPGSQSWTIDGLIDAYHKKYGDEALAQVLAVVTPDGNGAGLGYSIDRKKKWLSSYEIDHDKKVIYIDDIEAFSDHTNDEAAEALHDAISDIAKHIAFENESFWRTVGRIAMGTGLTVLGAAETVVGVVGIIVPEPGTTAAGVAVTTVGVSTAGEGVSMIFGANYGEGYNFLEEGFAAVGDLVGGNSGESLARTSFLVVNLVVSLGGSVKILKIPNQKFIMKGHWHGVSNNLKLADAIGDGFTVGRLQFMFKLRSGRVYTNVTNNTNQWFLRLQKVDGQVVINGRIIDTKNWHRLRNPAEVVKMLAKLVLHGF